MLDLNKDVFLNGNVQNSFEILLVVIGIQNFLCVFSVS